MLKGKKEENDIPPKAETRTNILFAAHLGKSQKVGVSSGRKDSAVRAQGRKKKRKSKKKKTNRERISLYTDAIRK